MEDLGVLSPKPKAADPSLGVLAAPQEVISPIRSNEPDPEFRSFTDIPAIRKNIYSQALKAAQEIPPVENKLFRLQVSNVHYADPETFSKKDHKKAILEGRSLARRLRGSWELVDKESGEVLDKKDVTIGSIPHMTDYGAFVVNGSEYTLAHQMRLLPGVYSRFKSTGEIESHLNVLPGHGVGSRVILDPEKKTFRLNIHQAQIPLLPVLRVLGMKDSDIQKAWGPEIFQVNNKDSDERSISKFYEKVSSKFNPNATAEEKRVAIIEAVKKMRLDPDVTQRTMGEKFSEVDHRLLMSITKKLVAINKGEVEPDDRDNLAYQKLMGPEDTFEEKVRSAPSTLRKMLWKATRNRNLSFLTPGFLNKTITSAIQGSGLGQNLEEVNPTEILDQLTRSTRLGEGGIASLDSVPDEARSVQPSQYGFVDSLMSPESLKAGIDTRIASGARKGKNGELYSQFIDTRTGQKRWVTPRQVADATIAFPREMRSGDEYVKAIQKGRMVYVPRTEVDYYPEHAEDTFAPITNLVAMKSGIKGQRVSMGGRMQTQALAVKNPESPLVETGIPGSNNESHHERLGSFVGAVRSEHQGKVVSVSPEQIVIQRGDGSTYPVELYNNHPFNRKSFLHNTPLVKINDRVQPGQLLAKSNYTDDKGRVAIGLNLKTGYIPYKGLNFEDAVVISRAAAKRLTSEHMYQEGIEWEPTHKKGKNNFISLFAAKYPKSIIDGMDEDGVILPGTEVHEDMPLVLIAKEKEASHNKVSATKDASHVDQSITWQHSEPGVVTDVTKTPKGVHVTIKSYNETKVGDKLSGLLGDKGVIAEIIDDDDMPVDEQGRPLEVLVNPLGTLTRANPAQIPLAILGKVAERTGKPYKFNDFDDVKDLIGYAQREARNHGINDLETVDDPVSGRRIPNVLVGNRYMLKLHHMAESKSQGRGLGSYTSDEIPSKGGEASSKRVSMMDLIALLSHGAPNIIRDASAVRGQKETNFYSALMMGKTLPEPKVPMVYNKFFAHLQGSGIHVLRKGGQIQLLAQTDKDIEELAGNRELENADTVDWKKGLRPTPGGLFDPTLTGGHGGNRWSFVKLHEAMPNPVMEEPIKKVLGLTESKFEEILAGREQLRGRSGPQAIAEALKAVDLEAEIKKARFEIEKGKASVRDNAVKRLGFLVGAKNTKLHPGDWIVNKVPVLPPIFRPVSVMAGNKLPMVSDPNYLYKELFTANKNLKDLSSQVDDVGEERLALYHSFKALAGLSDPLQPKLAEKGVRGMLKTIFASSPKFGMVQRKMLGSAVDVVGRAVITPNPNLDLDEVAIPETKAWDIYRPFLVRSLVRRGITPVRSMQLIKDKDPLAKKVLLEELENRPVIISRAPVLHRYGVMAFRPKLTKHETLQIPPTVVTGFNADFDGDQQINTVFACIDNRFKTDIVRACSLSAISLEDHAMPFTRVTVPSLSSEDSLYLFNLEDFPHAEHLKTTQGQFGPIEWFRVPEGFKVLACDNNGQPVWAPVTVWSRHAGCPVEIVTLQSGRQIVTDDDPRAVYGVKRGTLALSRATPTQALADGWLVPRLVDGGEVCDVSPRLTYLSPKHETASNRRASLLPEIPLTADFGYLVGVAAGDGWAISSGKDFCVAGISDTLVAKLDIIISSIFVDSAPKRCSVVSTASYGESRRHTWSSVELCSAVADLVGRGAATKHLPVWFLNTPRDFRSGLLAGLMDTDGSISVSRAKAKNAPQLMANISSTSIRLLQEAQLLCRSLGIRGRITASKTPGGNPFWMLALSNYDVQQWGGEHMVHVAKLQALASVTVEENTPARARQDLVPMSESLARAMCAAIPTPKNRKTWPEGLGTVYTQLSRVSQTGYVTRNIARRVWSYLPSAFSHPELAIWQQIVDNEKVTWDPVAKVEKTLQVETGYDLTVPGFETFTSADGIVLSNTMNYHVPVSDEAVREAYEKLLPSKNLFAVKNFKVHQLPKNEYVGGLFEASSAKPSGKREQAFDSIRSVLAAWKENKLNLNDTVSIYGDEE